MSDVQTDLLGKWVQYMGYQRGIVRAVAVVNGDVILTVEYVENRYHTGDSGRLDLVSVVNCVMSEPHR